MQTPVRMAGIIAGAAAAMLVSGCASYYQVREPVGGATYYTNDIQEIEKSGVIKFKDAKSGAMVTIQNSVVKEISSDEFDAGLKAQEQAKPAPEPTK